MEEDKQQKNSRRTFYQMIWRWHFYAGVIFTPIILMLSISGGIYLFKPQIEDIKYHDLFYVEQQGEMITAEEQIKIVQDEFPEATVKSIVPAYKDRSAVITIVQDEVSEEVYLNPSSGEVLGTLQSDSKIMQIFKDIHNGTLWGGTIGNRLVELAGSWMVILVFTGLYLWWPRGKFNIKGTFIPRLKKSGNKRLFWRDLHVVTAFWLSLFTILLLFSGLMWSEVFGKIAKDVVQETGYGSPVGDRPWHAFAFPESTVPLTKEVGKVPWAAQEIPIPNSTVMDTGRVTVDKIVEVVGASGVPDGYTIALPQTEKAVYSVFLDPADLYPYRPLPWTQTTIHIDQYSAEKLITYTWDDYGILGKIISLGIAFHQGEFGLISQIVILLVVIGIILFVVSSIIMWWKRKPQGQLGVPKADNRKFSIGAAIIMLIFGIIFPLAGLSMIVAIILDLVLFRHISFFK